MSDDPTEHPSANRELEKDRERTKRYALFAGVLLAAAAIYVVKQRGGKVDFEPLSGKFSLEVAVVEQLNVPTSTHQDGSDEATEYTTGTVTPEAITRFEQQQPILQGQFSGRNLIDTELGFVMSVPNPGRWELEYDGSDVLTTDMPRRNYVLIARNQRGTGVLAFIDIRVIEAPALQDLKYYVDKMLETGTGFERGESHGISYDPASQTAFLTLHPTQQPDPATGKSWRMAGYAKAILRQPIFRRVIVRYSADFVDDEFRDELRTMASSFTLIAP